MDPNVVVLEISSDEDVDWEGHDHRGITDGGDDHNWIAELLDEVNRDDCGYDDDSDEVVLVSEVLPSKKPRKKSTSKSSSLIDLDDDCVVLDHDPDKPMDAPNDNPIAGHEDDDSDDVLVVSEKGQVACRDYPHPRHLCIKFPFSSTPNQTHCHQCYCYVCDSLAPCVYWGNGSAIMDHCLATDKDDFWKLERQNSKKESKVVQSVLELADPNRFPPMNLTPLASDLFQIPSAAPTEVMRPNPIRASPISSNFGVPNVINQNRVPFSLSRSKYQPGLVSQQLIKTTNFRNSRDSGQPNYNLAIPSHGPVFKRTGSAAVLPTANRYSFSSYGDSRRNPCRRQDYRVNDMVSGPNVVNTCGSFSVPNPGSATVEPLPSQPEFSHNQPSSNTQFDFQPQINSDPVVFEPHLVGSQPQGQSFVPNYSIPTEDRASNPISVYSPQGNEGERLNIDPRFFHGINWPLSQSGERPDIDPKFFPGINWPLSQSGERPDIDPKFFHGINWPLSESGGLIEGTSATNESSVVSGGLVDYEYDNWGYNREAAAAAMEIPGALEPAFVDTENGRRQWY